MRSFVHGLSPSRIFAVTSSRIGGSTVLTAANIQVIASAREGTRHDVFRHQTYRIARLVGMGLIEERHAKNALMGEVMILGMRADGHTGRVEKYFNMAWEDGLAAIGRR